MPILQKKELKRLPSELSADWTWHPHPPTRAHSYPTPPVRTPPSLLDHALSSHAPGKSLGEQQLGETRGGHLVLQPSPQPHLTQGKTEVLKGKMYGLRWKRAALGSEITSSTRFQ